MRWIQVQLHGYEYLSECAVRMRRPKSAEHVRVHQRREDNEDKEEKKKRTRYRSTLTAHGTSCVVVNVSTQFARTYLYWWEDCRHCADLLYGRLVINGTLEPVKQASQARAKRNGSDRFLQYRPIFHSDGLGVCAWDRKTFTTNCMNIKIVVRATLECRMHELTLSYYI